MTVWFRSDDHDFHKNILFKYQPNRRALWNSLEEMREGMIARHNELVKPEDEVYFLGDVSYAQPSQAARYIERLNGIKYLVKGNHDGPAVNEQHCGHLWQWIKDYHEADIKCEKTGKGHRFCMLHFRMDRWHWMGRNSIHVFGHIHSNKLQESLQLRRFDVGVDANDCRPVSAQKIIDLANDTNFKPKGDEY